MGATRKKSQKGRIVRIAIIIVIILAILAVGVLILQDRVAEEYGAGSETEVQTGTVTVGSISTIVSGSGNLTDEEAEPIEVLSMVEIKEIVVEAGDAVEEGDLLAKVEMSSVVAAMSDIQDELDALDSNLKDAEADSVDSSIAATVSGRVKVIYAQQDDDVATVMYEHGALAILSLDGYMAADIETAQLQVGDTVTVICSDGTGYDGTVSAMDGEKATVLITDDGTVFADSVSVIDGSGNDVGSGELYIHEPLVITGYVGTVAGVSVDENAKISAGKKLFTLTDTEYNGNYNSLLAERKELEEQLQSLMTIYKEGAIYAPLSGIVSIDEGSSETESASANSTSVVQSAESSQTISQSEDEGELQMQTVLSICPGNTMTISISVDESSILSLSVNQEATVTVDSLGDEAYTGVVTEIDSTGTTAGGVTSYTAVITLDKAEKMLSGMSASASIKIEGVENALLIPSAALTQTSSAAYVYTSYNEETGELEDMVEVSVGLNNGTLVEITEGLSVDDAVYYIEFEEEGFRFGNSDMPGEMNFGGSMPDGMNFGGNMPANRER